MRMSRRTVFPFIAVIAWISQSSPALQAAPIPENITEPRNAATGFAITQWMTNMDSLGKFCSKLKGDAGSRSLQSLKAWQQRNAPYVTAAFSYMVTVEDLVLSRSGEEARKTFRADRTAEFIKGAHESEAVWFPSAQVDDKSCLHLAAMVDSGAMDLDKSKEFYPTLMEIKADMDKNH